MACAACANLKTRCGACSLRALSAERTALRKGIKRALAYMRGPGSGRADRVELALLAAIEEADEVAHD